MQAVLQSIFIPIARTASEMLSTKLSTTYLLIIQLLASNFGSYSLAEHSSQNGLNSAAHDLSVFNASFSQGAVILFLMRAT